MVRAAGLYPAGSRFESWLPYQPPTAVARVPTPRRSPGSARSARPAGPAVRARAGGRDASQAGICSGRHDRAGRRPATVGSARDDRRVDLHDEVALGRGDPAPDALAVARRPLERVLEVGPAAVGAGGSPS